MLTLRGHGLHLTSRRWVRPETNKQRRRGHSDVADMSVAAMVPETGTERDPTSAVIPNAVRRGLRQRRRRSPRRGYCCTSRESPGGPCAGRLAGPGPVLPIQRIAEAAPGALRFEVLAVNVETGGLGEPLHDRPCPVGGDRRRRDGHAGFDSSSFSSTHHASERPHTYYAYVCAVVAAHSSFERGGVPAAVEDGHVLDPVDVAFAPGSVGPRPQLRVDVSPVVPRLQSGRVGLDGIEEPGVPRGGHWPRTSD